MRLNEDEASHQEKEAATQERGTIPSTAVAFPKEQELGPRKDGGAQKLNGAQNFPDIQMEVGHATKRWEEHESEEKPT